MVKHSYTAWGPILMSLIMALTLVFQSVARADNTAAQPAPENHEQTAKTEDSASLIMNDASGGGGGGGGESLWKNKPMPQVTENTNANVFTMAADGETMYAYLGGSTTLAADMEGYSDTLQVYSTAGFPSSGSIAVYNWDEPTIVEYGGKTSTSFTGVTGLTTSFYQGEAVIGGALYKSTDGGISWFSTGLGDGLEGVNLTRIKVSRYSASDLIATDGINIWVSVDAGVSWDTNNPPDYDYTSDKIFSVDISLGSSGRTSYMAGYTGGLALWGLNSTEWASTAYETSAIDLDSQGWDGADAIAVAFSPSYANDDTIVAVARVPYTSVKLRTNIVTMSGSVLISYWNGDVRDAAIIDGNDTFAPDENTDDATDTLIASIGFPTNYSPAGASSNRIFVGIGDTNLEYPSYGIDVYRINGGFSYSRAYSLEVWANCSSIAFAGSMVSGLLVVGQYNSSDILSTTGYNSNSDITWYNSADYSKSPSSDAEVPDTRVMFSPDSTAADFKLYAGTAGLHSALFLSTDANSFEGISLVSFSSYGSASLYGSSITFCGSDTQFIKLSDGNRYFLFKSTDSGASWRMIRDNGSVSFTINLSPAYATDQTIFLAQAHGPFGPITSDHRKYVKSIDGGATWATYSVLGNEPYSAFSPIDDFNYRFASANGKGIRSTTTTWVNLDGTIPLVMIPIPGFFMVYTYTGEIYVSTNSGESFTRCGDLWQFNPSHAAFSPANATFDVATKTLYAIDATTGNIVKWVYGKSTVWSVALNYSALPFALRSGEKNGETLGSGISSISLASDGSWYITSTNNLNGQIWRSSALNANFEAIPSTTPDDFGGYEGAICSIPPLWMVVNEEDNIVIYVTIHLADFAPTGPNKYPYMILASEASSPDPNIETDFLKQGEVKAFYTETLLAVKGSGPYTWSLKKGSKLPPGLKLTTNSPDTFNATISGKPTKNGTFPFRVRLVDSAGAEDEKQFTIVIHKAISLSAPSIPKAEVDAEFPAWTPTAKYGNGEYSWSFTGVSPEGLHFSTSTGALSGEPQESGKFNFLLIVEDNLGGKASKKMSFTVLEPLNIVTSYLPNGDPVVTYKTTYLKATGGASTKTWTRLSGNMPPGLKLSAKGAISGKPEEGSSGYYAFIIKVEDKIGSDYQYFDITINDPLAIDPLPNGVVNEYYDYILTATGGSGGYKYAKSGTWPKWLKLDTKTNRVYGTPTTAGTYSFKVKVTDSLGGNRTQSMIIFVSKYGGVQYGGVLTIITGSPMNLGVPWAGTTPSDLFYACPAVETLLRPDENGVPVPWLATGWTVAPDYKSITFTLRQGVKFHDGTDFNAEALKYNFETQAKSPMPDLKAITSVDVIDDYTARVNLTKYEPHIFSLLATGRPGWIVSPTAAAKMTADEMKIHPVGTGPFKFQEFKRDTYVKFSRFDQYWQTGKPYLDGVQYDIIVDPVTAMMAFKSGKELVHWNPTPKEASDLKKEGYRVTAARASIYQWIPDSANQDSPWSQLKVRQAAQYAIDTVAMAKAQGYGFADPYWNQVFPKGNPAYNPEIIGYPYNPDKAKQLLAAAGYPNGFKTTLLTTTPPLGDFEIATQNYLKQVGIDAEMKPLPPPAYMAMNQQGWTNGLYRSQSVASVGADPGYQLQNYLGTPAIYWKSAARPQSVQDLIEASKTENDVSERNAILRDLCKDIIDDHALIISVWGGYLASAKQNQVMDDNIHTIWTMNWTPENAWLER